MLTHTRLKTGIQKSRCFRYCVLVLTFSLWPESSRVEIQDFWRTTRIKKTWLPELERWGDRLPCWAVVAWGRWNLLDIRAIVGDTSVLNATLNFTGRFCVWRGKKRYGRGKSPWGEKYAESFLSYHVMCCGTINFQRCRSDIDFSLVSFLWSKMKKSRYLGFFLLSRTLVLQAILTNGICIAKPIGQMTFMNYVIWPCFHSDFSQTLFLPLFFFFLLKRPR